jgi:hypothetical protein
MSYIEMNILEIISEVLIESITFCYLFLNNFIL